MTAVDTGALRIADEPYVRPRKVAGASKYLEIFEALQENQRIVCPPDDVHRIASALRKWLHQSTGMKHTVSIVTRCSDGMGGVWHLGPKPAARPALFWPGARKVK